MTFFLDLWHDLREKRLWPVAVGLVAAIVAIPVVLAKPASSDSSSAPSTIAAAPPAGVQLPAFSVDVNAGDKGSNLDTYSAHNPFQPMKDLAAKPATASTTTAAASTPSASKTSSAGGSASTGSSKPASSGSSGSGGAAPSSQVVTKQTTSWIYTATFQFGSSGHMKTVKDAKPFTMLPDDTKASLIFASAGADGKSAIFYIQDTTLQPQGEGHCNAPGDKCRFVTLTTDEAHNEEAFISADGTTEYDVKLLSIGRHTLTPADSGSTSKKKNTGKSTNGKIVAGAGKTDAAQPSLDFLPVLLGFTNTTETRTVTQRK